MIGLIVCTHHRLGQALVDAAEMIVGPYGGVAVIGVNPGDDMDALIGQLRDAREQVDTGAGAVVMCDMFGGTPSNLSLSFLGQKDENVEVVTGVNLPMLLKFYTSRASDDLPGVAQTVRDHARQNILVAGDLLRGKGRS